MDDYLTLPVAFIVFLVVIDVILFGFVTDEGTERVVPAKPSAHCTVVADSAPWSPTHVDWGVMAQSSAEIGAVCGVIAISMLLDVSSLEVARQKIGDLDKEFRTNGLANLLASVLGGFGGISP